MGLDFSGELVCWASLDLDGTKEGKGLGQKTEMYLKE